MSEQQVYLLVAGTSTALFLVKMLLMIFGGDTDDGELGGGAAESEGDFDGDMDDGSAQSTFMVFSTQTILSFLMGFGWMCLAARYEMNLGRFPSMMLGVIFGAIMFALTSYLLNSVGRLNKSAKFDITKAVGLNGSAYVKIPAKNKGEGRVQIEVGGRQKILRAFNTTDVEINSFDQIIVEKVENGILYIKPIAK